MNIAFLGLGKMGAGMAFNLAKHAEHSLTVWNRSADKAQVFAEMGATVAATPAEAVRGADVVITSLLDDQSVEALFHSDSPVLAALRPNAIHLCVTTVSPECADRLYALHRAHGSRYVSAPVIGRPDVARAGKLIQFLAGDEGAIAEVQPVCRLFCEQVKVLHGLPAGVANSQKLCLNFFAVAAIEVMAECFTLGEKLGVPRENLAFFLNKALPAPALNVYVEKLFKRDTQSGTGFTMTGGRKDVGLMLQAAAKAHCPLDIAEVVANKMDSALAQNMHDLDWSAIQEMTRQRAGLV